MIDMNLNNIAYSSEEETKLFKERIKNSILKTETCDNNPKNVIGYDLNNNVIYKSRYLKEDDLLFEEWWECDEKGRSIHYINSNETESRIEYLMDGSSILYNIAHGEPYIVIENTEDKEIYYKSKDYERWTIYDDNNYHLLHSFDTKGFEEYNKIDKRGVCREAFHKTSYGAETLDLYDSRLNKTYRYEKDYKGHESWTKFKYDEKRNVIYKLDHDGNEENFIYDENNRLLYKKTSKGVEEWYNYKNKSTTTVNNLIDRRFVFEYDNIKNRIFIKDLHGKSKRFYYDDDNELVAYEIIVADMKFVYRRTKNKFGFEAF